IPALEAAGKALYEARAKYMIDTGQGLTRTYNALKDRACVDPRILELRRLHEAVDRAVLDAYLWTQVSVPPYCQLTTEETAAADAFEQEIIDRVYALNAKRDREEQRLGVGKKKTAKQAKSSGLPKGKRVKSTRKGDTLLPQVNAEDDQ
ncbi:MAG TPA: hypothetical protein VFN67_10265, partial [Polyangiales bacterium]|nr:hypothetical protein [Polyangiales bacterium]